MRGAWVLTWIGIGLGPCLWAVAQEEGAKGPGADAAAIHPLMRVLDADSDGVISARELRVAAKALKELDLNDDGELTPGEYLPEGADDRRGAAPVTAPHPLLVALDADSDGVLSAAEISRAARVLRRLDRNRDGQLTPDELLPGPGPALGAGADRRGAGAARDRRPGGGMPGFGVPGPGAGGGAGRIGGAGIVPGVVGGGGVGAGGVAGGGFSRPPGAGLPPQISKLMGFDQNKDGRVTADELPENMRGLIKLLDLNGDGAVDLRELRQALRNPAARGGR